MATADESGRHDRILARGITRVFPRHLYDESRHMHPIRIIERRLAPVPPCHKRQSCEYQVGEGDLEGEQAASCVRVGVRPRKLFKEEQMSQRMSLKHLTHILTDQASLEKKNFRSDALSHEVRATY